MAFFPSLRRLFDRLANSSRSRRPERPRKRPGCQLFMESLEERWLLATRTFTNPAGGAWSLASNWDGGILPAAADDVVINLPSVNAPVTYSAAATAVASLTSNARFEITGGTLTVNGNAHFGNQLVLNGTGATLEGTVLSAGTRVRGTNNGGNLHRVSLAGV